MRRWYLLHDPNTRTTTESPTERVLDRLGEAEKCGEGWKSRCPAHDDREPSLSIGTGDDGRVLLKCFAGCTNEEIVSVLGLALADLFPSPNGHDPYPPATLTLEEYAEAKS